MRGARRARSIAAVQPLHVATWIELQTQTRAAPSVKQRLAAIRHLFDWLVTGQVDAGQPRRFGARPVAYRAPGQDAGAGAGRGARAARQHRRHDAGGPARPGADRAHGLFSFARVGAALGMKVEDVFTQNRRLWVRLREKGGKAHAMPCHHSLEEYLHRLSGADRHRGGRQGAAVPHDRPRHRPAHAHPPAPGQRLCDDRAAAPRRPASTPRSATTVSARPGSPPISRTAARWKRRPRWRTMPARAPRSSTIAGATR